MTDIQKSYLCGGTFFFLLLQARYNKTTSSRDYVNGEKEDKADCYVMDKLVYAVTGNNSYTSIAPSKRTLPNIVNARYRGALIFLLMTLLSQLHTLLT